MQGAIRNRTVLQSAMLLIILVLVFLLHPEVHGGTLKESWYMSRGKANMQIRNYKAAIEAFEKLVELDPANREAMRLLGLAYESQGLTDKAIEHYDRHLQRFPDDADVAFKQARYLEGTRFSYRRNDAIRYYRMGLKANPHSHENRRRLAKLLAGNARTVDQAVEEYKILLKDSPRDAGLRAEYARLLGSRSQTIDPAIQQYEILADQTPRNSVVHRELAAAYAWQGDNDRAIYHAQLALRYDSHDKAAQKIRNDLMKGREPMIKAGATYLSQSGNDSHYDYSGFIVNGGGKTDITPFATLDAEAGFETYRNNEPHVDGPFYQVSLQGRFNPSNRVDLDWKYHDFEEAEADTEFLAQYSVESGSLVISPGVRRAFKYDSLLSLAGGRDSVTGRKIGAARSNTAFCRFGFEGERFQVSAVPYGGYVSAESTGNNTLIGADADARYRLSDSGAFVFSVLYKFQISHYEKDASGFADTPNGPAAGGYFSPDLFINNVLDLEVDYQPRPSSKLLMIAGPSIQYWQGHVDEDEWNAGLDFDLVYQKEISRRLLLTAEASYFQIANVYRRLALTALIGYRF